MMPASSAQSLEITIRKNGFADWSRKLNVTGGNVHLNVELEAATPSPVSAPIPAPVPAPQ
jgi:hypothetical protein